MLSKNELDASGANLGYRRIWVSLKRQKILVKEGRRWKRNP